MVLDYTPPTFSSSSGGLQPLAATMEPFRSNNGTLRVQPRKLKIHLENFAEIYLEISAEICLKFFAEICLVSFLEFCCGYKFF